MKIFSLKAENIKRLKYVEFTFDGKTFVLVTGRNNQGKSTFLDLLKMAFGKLKPKKPVRNGEKNGSIIVQTDKYLIEKFYEDDKEKLKVKTPDGQANYSSPQTLLDSLKSDLCFDPLEFYHMDFVDQIQVLLSLGKFEKDPQKIDDEIKKTYDERTQLNREFKKYKSLVEEMPKPDVNLPDEEVSVLELVQQKDKAEEHNRQFNEWTKIILDREKSAILCQEEINFHKEEIEKLEVLINKHIKESNEANALLKNAELKDITEILVQIKNAEETNRKIRGRNSYMNLVNLQDEAFQNSENKTGKIEELREERKRILTNGSLPINNLYYDDGVIFYEEVPLDQVSDSDQIMISYEIAKALNPELKIIITKDGDKLDVDKLKRLIELGEKDGYFLMIERIHSDGLPCLVIEDGAILGSTSN